jgi:ketosteroid isomerase-like protein
MIQETDSESVLRQYVAAVQAGDVKAIRGMFAEDAAWTLHAGRLAISGTWTGRDAIIDGFLAEAMARYEPGSVSLEITGMIAEHEQVVLQWTSRAQARDGRPYENGCIGVFTVRDGRIQDVREYMDTLYASEVAFTGSVSPSPAVAGGR